MLFPKSTFLYGNNYRITGIWIGRGLRPLPAGAPPRSMILVALLPTLESRNASRENPCHETIRAQILHFSDAEILHFSRRVDFGRRECPVHVTIATIFRAVGPIGIRATVPRVFIHRHTAALAELVHCCVSPLSSRSSNVPKFGKCGEWASRESEANWRCCPPCF